MVPCVYFHVLILSDLILYHHETLELMLRRWVKLEKDFKLKNGHFDITKVPDIYDCIKYDMQHNYVLRTMEFTHMDELYNCAENLADFVIPQVCVNPPSTKALTHPQKSQHRFLPVRMIGLTLKRLPPPPPPDCFRNNFNAQRSHCTVSWLFALKYRASFCPFSWFIYKSYGKCVFS